MKILTPGRLIIMKTKEFFSGVMGWEPVGKVRETDGNIRPMRLAPLLGNLALKGR